MLPHQRHDLLQEAGHVLAGRAFKSQGLKEGQDVLARAMVHDASLAQQQDVVKQGDRLRRRLQQTDHISALVNAACLAQVLTDAKRCGAVQACGDLVHRHHRGASHHELACRHTLALAAADAAQQGIANHGVFAHVEPKIIKRCIDTQIVRFVAMLVRFVNHLHERCQHVQLGLHGLWVHLCAPLQARLSGHLHILQIHRTLAQLRLEVGDAILQCLPYGGVSFCKCLGGLVFHKAVKCEAHCLQHGERGQVVVLLVHI
mmetsp:Transcript_33340/g.83542  ORF Transcript_33340/g.83542 Transcript_33340/m.83542 type:complete len:259 (+) Transcript_33340:3160-3936(+)